MINDSNSDQRTESQTAQMSQNNTSTNKEQRSRGRRLRWLVPYGVRRSSVILFELRKKVALLFMLLNPMTYFRLLRQARLLRSEAIKSASTEGDHDGRSEQQGEATEKLPENILRIRSMTIDERKKHLKRLSINKKIVYCLFMMLIITVAWFYLSGEIFDVFWLVVNSSLFALTLLAKLTRLAIAEQQLRYGRLIRLSELFQPDASGGIWLKKWI